MWRFLLLKGRQVKERQWPAITTEQVPVQVTNKEAAPASQTSPIAPTLQSQKTPKRQSQKAKEKKTKRGKQAEQTKTR